MSVRCKCDVCGFEYWGKGEINTILGGPSRAPDCPECRKAWDKEQEAKQHNLDSSLFESVQKLTTDRNRPGLHEVLPNGQNKEYLILSDEERKKGFIRPVRKTYIHKDCHTSTTMSLEIAETYARDPYFYGATFCVHCGKHFPLIYVSGEHKGERAFTWEDGTGVGE